MGSAGIPTLDFRAWRAGGPDRAAFVRELGESLETWGFAAIDGHGVPDDLVDRCYALAEQLFALPDAIKRRYEAPEEGRQRGYTSFGVEHARNRDIADLKEFWHVGRELPAGHPRAAELPTNRLPVEIPELAPAFRGLFDALDAFSLDLLEAVGQHLELPAGWFPSRVRDGNSVLRVIHYPPLPPEAPPGAVRAAEHEDINLITVLPVSTEPGLELLTRDGRWLPVSPPTGTLICDTGDMMQLLTGGRIPATTHRVVNPLHDVDRPRFSMPFFVHPLPSVRLDPLDGSRPGPTAGEFLRQRLLENGVA